MNQRVRSDTALAELFGGGWPAFISADQVVSEHLERVREWFADLELVLLDGDQPVAAGWAVPLSWNGSVPTLPGGYTDAMVRAVRGRELDVAPDTLVVMAAQVHPARQGSGLAGELIAALCALAADRGLARVVAPLRPAAKARYPLTPIDQYASWTRADGLPLDPWQRTHARLGARTIATTAASQTMTGTVAQWERWTGLALPSTGTYVIADGLAPLTVDRERGTGTYVEPGIWVQHR